MDSEWKYAAKYNGAYNNGQNILHGIKVRIWQPIDREALSNIG